MHNADVVDVDFSIHEKEELLINHFKQKLTKNYEFFITKFNM